MFIIEREGKSSVKSRYLLEFFSTYFYTAFNRSETNHMVSIECRGIQKWDDCIEERYLLTHEQTKLSISTTTVKI